MFMEIQPDGTVIKRGIEHGAARLVARKGDLLAIHQAGRSHWQEVRGPWGYAPARFEVYRVLQECPDGVVEVELFPALEWPVRRQARL